MVDRTLWQRNSYRERHRPAPSLLHHNHILDILYMPSVNQYPLAPIAKIKAQISGTNVHRELHTHTYTTMHTNVCLQV
jgi:hypothetical protein